jgi:hypothetical protein
VSLSVRLSDINSRREEYIMKKIIVSVLGLLAVTGFLFLRDHVLAGSQPRMPSQKVLGCICSIDPKASRLTILPYDENAKKWLSAKKESLAFTSKTIVVGLLKTKTTMDGLAGGHVLKMAHLAGIDSGGPKFNSFEIKSVPELVGERATLDINRKQSPPTIELIELEIAFGGESMDASLGAGSSKVLSGKCSCTK